MKPRKDNLNTVIWLLILPILLGILSICAGIYYVGNSNVDWRKCPAVISNVNMSKGTFVVSGDLYIEDSMIKDGTIEVGGAIYMGSYTILLDNQIETQGNGTTINIGSKTKGIEIKNNSMTQCNNPD